MYYLQMNSGQKVRNKMSDIELIVKIPRSLYANLKTIKHGSIASSRIFECVKNGIPLSKKTIDADELLKRISEKAKTPSLSEDTVNGLCGATAIIYDMLNESGKEQE